MLCYASKQALAHHLAWGTCPAQEKVGTMGAKNFYSLTTFFFLGAKATRRKTEFGPWLDLALSWGRNVRPNSVSGGLEYHLKPSFAHICLDACMDG